MVKKIIITLLLLIIISTSYLSYFGITTNLFNERIEKKLNESYPNVNIKLEDVKVLLDIFKLSINVKTKNPTIIIEKEEIELKEISSIYKINSIFKNEFVISYLLLNTKQNKIKKVIKLLRSHKDSAQLIILDKIIKDGNIEILAKLNFNSDGKFIKNGYEIISSINNLSFKLFDGTELKNISFNVNFTQNNIYIKNLNSNYLGINLISDEINIKIKKNFFIINGNLKSIENNIPQKILSQFVKDKNIKNLVLSSDNNFSFNISNKFKISEKKIFSEIYLKEAEYKFKNKNIKKYLSNYKDNIKLIDHLIKIKYENSIFINGRGKIEIGGQEDEIQYKIDLKDDKLELSLDADLNNNPLKISLLDFYKKEKEKSKLNISAEINDKKIIFKKISLISGNSNFLFENFNVSKSLKISKFEKIKLNYQDNKKNKNDLYIKKYDKNNYSITGNNFSLTKIIDDILFSKNDNNVKIFESKNLQFKIDFKRNRINENYYLLNLKGEFQIKNNEIVDLILDSRFDNKKSISLTIKSKNNKKITTFNSDFAEPFVKKYNFIKGFEDGKIDFYSIKENKVSQSKLNIYDFRLKELPALTKILTLASLQGIADLLSGEGVGFNELEMNFKNEKKLLEIDELYAIGPALSILMEGYIQEDQLISLRGTLVPATTINKFVSSIPILGDILVGKKTGEGVFGVSFKIKGPPKETKTTVNPIKTLTPRFITRTLEKIKKSN